jgi:hypothetical protein
VSLSTSAEQGVVTNTCSDTFPCLCRDICNGKSSASVGDKF